MNKEIATNLELDDRIYETLKKQAFLTLKDDKPNFKNNPTYRLLNPTKTDLGEISKQKLANIVKVVTEKTKANLWRSTHSVFTWFRELANKAISVFIQFDVVDFYPSITEVLLNKALDYAKYYIHISD